MVSKKELDKVKETIKEIKADTQKPLETKYCVDMVYFDDYRHQILVSKVNLERFFTAIGTNKVYMDSDLNMGWWVNFEKIRFIELSEKGA